MKIHPIYFTNVTDLTVVNDTHPQSVIIESFMFIQKHWICFYF